MDVLDKSFHWVQMGSRNTPNWNHEKLKSYCCSIDVSYEVDSFVKHNLKVFFFGLCHSVIPDRRTKTRGGRWEKGGIGSVFAGYGRWPFRTPSPLYCLFCRPQRPNFGAHICHFLFMHINPYKAKFSSANRLLNSLLSQHSLFLKIPNCATNSIQSNPLYGYTLIADTSLLWSRVFSVFPVENPYYILYKSSPLNTDTPINADNGHSFISLVPTFLL